LSRPVSRCVGLLPLRPRVPDAAPSLGVHPVLALPLSGALPLFGTISCARTSLPSRVPLWHGYCCFRQDSCFCEPFDFPGNVLARGRGVGDVGHGHPGKMPVVSEEIVVNAGR
jgi:hypothetical protein